MASWYLTLRCLLLPNEEKYGNILFSNQNKKRGYRVAALVIPTPTPEWPRRQAWGDDSTKSLSGQVGSGFLTYPSVSCLKSCSEPKPTLVADQVVSVRICEARFCSHRHIILRVFSRMMVAFGGVIFRVLRLSLEIIPLISGDHIMSLEGRQAAFISRKAPLRRSSAHYPL